MRQEIKTSWQYLTESVCVERVSINQIIFLQSESNFNHHGDLMINTSFFLCKISWAFSYDIHIIKLLNL